MQNGIKYSIKSEYQDKSVSIRFLAKMVYSSPSLNSRNSVGRNPKIIEFLHVYKYVKEFGEGVDRMYREMEDAGLPDPEYHVSSFMLCATLKNQKWGAAHKGAGESPPPQKSLFCDRRKDIGVLFCSTFSCRIA